MYEMLIYGSFLHLVRYIHLRNKQTPYLQPQASALRCVYTVLAYLTYIYVTNRPHFCTLCVIFIYITYFCTLCVIFIYVTHFCTLCVTFIYVTNSCTLCVTYIYVTHRTPYLQP